MIGWNRKLRQVSHEIIFLLLYRCAIFLFFKVTFFALILELDFDIIYICIYTFFWYYFSQPSMRNEEIYEQFEALGRDCK